MDILNIGRIKYEPNLSNKQIESENFTSYEVIRSLICLPNITHRYKQIKKLQILEKQKSCLPHNAAFRYREQEYL